MKLDEIGTGSGGCKVILVKDLVTNKVNNK